MKLHRVIVPVVVGLLSLVWLFDVAHAATGHNIAPTTILSYGAHYWTSGSPSCVYGPDNEYLDCTGTIPASASNWPGISLYISHTLPIEPDVTGLRLVFTMTRDYATQVELWHTSGDHVDTGGTHVLPTANGTYTVCWNNAPSVGSCDTMIATTLQDENNPFNLSHNRIRIHFRGQGSVPSNVSFRLKPELVMWYDPDLIDPPESPPSSTIGAGFGCVVSYTETITNDDGITTTQTITYTVPDANLLKNPSFENTHSIMGNNVPQEWDPVRGGAVDYSVGDIAAGDETVVRTGSRTVYNLTDFELWGSPDRVLPSGFYLVGYYARCATGLLSCANDSADMRVGSSTITGTTAVSLSSVYNSYSGTISLGGGVPNVILEFDWTSGNPYTFVDDTFMVPVDATGAISCTADLYPPETYGATPIGGIPGPVGAAGTTCYQCTPPATLAASAVSYWVAWLGCVLRNMFSCSLRVWLLIIGNWISGLINQGEAWIAWVPMTMAQGAGWLGVALSNLTATVVSAGTNGFDLLIAVIELLTTLINSITNIVLGLFDVLINFMSLIPDALEAPKIGFTLNGTDYSGFSPGAFTTDGPSEEKIVYLFLSGIGMVDTQVFTNQYVNVALYVVLGTASFLALFWAIKQWSESIRF